MPISWVLLDLNGTLLDPGCLAGELDGRDDVLLVEQAFDEAILHAMADTLSGAYSPLPDYLRAALERRLVAAGRATDGVDAAMRRAGAMTPFADARAALDLLAAAGLRLAVLSNSSMQAARLALEHGGLAEALDAILGSDAVGVFKPHPDIYRYALGRLDLRPEDGCMVAAHAWDLAGANRVGLRTAWVARRSGPFPAVFPTPDVRAPDLLLVATEITKVLVRQRR